MKELRVGVSYLSMDRYYLPLEARGYKRNEIAQDRKIKPDEVSEDDCIERYIFECDVMPDKSDSDMWQIDFVEEEGSDV